MAASSTISQSHVTNLFNDGLTLIYSFLDLDDYLSLALTGQRCYGMVSLGPHQSFSVSPPTYDSIQPLFLSPFRRHITDFNLKETILLEDMNLLMAALPNLTSCLLSLDSSPYQSSPSAIFGQKLLTMKLDLGGHFDFKELTEEEEESILQALPISLTNLTLSCQTKSLVFTHLDNLVYCWLYIIGLPLEAVIKLLNTMSSLRQFHSPSSLRTAVSRGAFSSLNAPQLEVFDAPSASSLYQSDFMEQLHRSLPGLTSLPTPFFVLSDLTHLSKWKQLKEVVVFRPHGSPADVFRVLAECHNLTTLKLGFSVDEWLWRKVFLSNPLLTTLFLAPDTSIKSVRFLCTSPAAAQLTSLSISRSNMVGCRLHSSQLKFILSCTHLRELSMRGAFTMSFKRLIQSFESRSVLPTLHSLHVQANANKGNPLIHTVDWKLSHDQQTSREPPLSSRTFEVYPPYPPIQRKFKTSSAAIAHPTITKKSESAEQSIPPDPSSFTTTVTSYTTEPSTSPSVPSTATIMDSPPAAPLIGIEKNPGPGSTTLSSGQSLHPDFTTPTFPSEIQQLSQGRIMSCNWSMMLPSDVLFTIARFLPSKECLVDSVLVCQDWCRMIYRMPSLHRTFTFNLTPHIPCCEHDRLMCDEAHEPTLGNFSLAPTRYHCTSLVLKGTQWDEWEIPQPACNHLLALQFDTLLTSISSNRRDKRIYPPKLRSLKLSLCNGTHWVDYQEEIELISLCAPNLTSLHVTFNARHIERDSVMSDDFFDTLAPTLTSLHFDVIRWEGTSAHRSSARVHYSSSCGGEPYYQPVMSHLRTFPHLIDLRLPSGVWTSRDIKAFFSGMDSNDQPTAPLETMVWDTPWEADSIHMIGRLTSLTSLQLIFTPADCFNEFSFLVQLPHVRQVSLVGDSDIYSTYEDVVASPAFVRIPSEHMLTCLIRCQSIQELDLAYEIRISNHELHLLLIHLIHLRRLSLRECGVTSLACFDVATALSSTSKLASFPYALSSFSFHGMIPSHLSPPLHDLTYLFQWVHLESVSIHPPPYYYPDEVTELSPLISATSAYHDHLQWIWPSLVTYEVDQPKLISRPTNLASFQLEEKDGNEEDTETEQSRSRETEIASLKESFPSSPAINSPPAVPLVGVETNPGPLVLGLWQCPKCNHSEIPADQQECPSCLHLRVSPPSPRHLLEDDYQQVSEYESKFEVIIQELTFTRAQSVHASDHHQFHRFEKTKQNLKDELSHVWHQLQDHLPHSTDGQPWTPIPSSSASSFTTDLISAVEGDEENSRSSSPSLPGIIKRRHYSLVEGMNYRQQSFKRFQQHWSDYLRGRVDCPKLIQDTKLQVTLVLNDQSISPAALGSIGLLCASTASLLYSYHLFDDAYRILALGSQLVNRPCGDHETLELAQIHLCLSRSFCLRRQMRVCFKDRPDKQRSVLIQAMLYLKEAASRYQQFAISYYEPFMAAELLSALTGIMFFCKELSSQSVEALPGTSHTVIPTLKPQDLTLVQNPWNELKHEFQYLDTDSNDDCISILIKHAIDLCRCQEVELTTWVNPVLRMVTHLRNMRQWQECQKWIDLIPIEKYDQLPMLCLLPLCRGLLALYQYQCHQLTQQPTSTIHSLSSPKFDFAERIYLVYSLIMKSDRSKLAPIDDAAVLDLKRQILDMQQAHILRSPLSFGSDYLIPLTAQTLFKDGLILVYSYMTDLEWLMALKTCRLWYATACSSPSRHLDYGSFSPSSTDISSTSRLNYHFTRFSSHWPITLRKLIPIITQLPSLITLGHAIIATQSSDITADQVIPWSSHLTEIDLNFNGRDYPHLFKSICSISSLTKLSLTSTRRRLGGFIPSDSFRPLIHLTSLQISSDHTNDDVLQFGDPLNTYLFLPATLTQLVTHDIPMGELHKCGVTNIRHFSGISDCLQLGDLNRLFQVAPKLEWLENVDLGATDLDDIKLFTHLNTIEFTSIPRWRKETPLSYETILTGMNIVTQCPTVTRIILSEHLSLEYTAILQHLPHQIVELELKSLTGCDESLPLWSVSSTLPPIWSHPFIQRISISTFSGREAIHVETIKNYFNSPMICPQLNYLRIKSPGREFIWDKSARINRLENYRTPIDG